MTQRVLIIKTSSLGDVVHMLPAVTDLAAMIPGVQIDWVVEEGFSEIPSWHPAVDQVMPVAIRRWRKSLLAKNTRVQMRKFRQRLRQRDYDFVIDSQGLVKSALIARMAFGSRCGYDKNSIREPLASIFYQQRLQVSRELHAIERNRRLCASILGYQLSALPLDYGISKIPFPHEGGDSLPGNPYIVAFHGTSRIDKEWPEEYWHALIRRMHEDGVSVLLPWGNEREKARAQSLAAQSDAAVVLPRSGLTTLAAITKKASAVIGMDTGLMHVAAALGQSGIALYPATKPELTGVLASDESERGIENLAGDDAMSVEMVIERMVAYIE